MHPTKDIIGTEGDNLKGVKVAMCITGSVAAVRCPDLSRTLMRQGAEVRVVMSRSATELITPELMHWATGEPVISELTGDVEHVEIGQWADLILVVPSTANTIGKIANAIDDTPPTSVVSVALGLEKPIGIVPAMHSSMYSHEIIQENVSRLKDAGVHFLEPNILEGKAKIPSVEEIVSFVKSISQPKDLEGKKVLVTAGPTVERLDPVRVLTNPSSGKMGISIARAAAMRGADVTLIYGTGDEPEPFGVNTVRVETTGEMMDAVVDALEGDFDIIVAAAAPQDFTPESPSEEKLRREEPVNVKLVPTPSILEKASEMAPEAFLVGFKAECDGTDDQLQVAAEKKMKEHDLDLVVANDVMRPGAGFGTESNEVLIYSPSGSRGMKAPKLEIANSILDVFAEEYAG